MLPRLASLRRNDKRKPGGSSQEQPTLVQGMYDEMHKLRITTFTNQYKFELPSLP